MINTIIGTIEALGSLGLIAATGFLSFCIIIAIGILIVFLAVKYAIPSIKQMLDNEREKELREAKEDPEFLEIYRLYKKNKSN